MNPNIWGPKLWFSLHTITLNYPENPTYKHKKLYNNFFTNLQYLLPCSVCCKNYKTHLDKFPISENLKCKKDLVLWLINIHNEVNKQLGKPVISPVDALKKIFNEYKKEDLKYKFKNYNWTYIIIISFLVILGIFITYILIKRRNRNQYYTIQNGGRYNLRIPKINRNIYYRNRF